MYIPTTQWEHPDTKATLVAMQAKIKEAQAETTRHNGDRSVFVAAMREAVALGTACLNNYPDPVVDEDEDEAGGEGAGGDDV